MEYASFTLKILSNYLHHSDIFFVFWNKRYILIGVISFAWFLYYTIQSRNEKFDVSSFSIIIGKEEQFVAFWLLP